MIKLQTHRLFTTRKSNNYQTISEAYRSVCQDKVKAPVVDLAVLKSDKKLNFAQKTLKFIKSIFNANKMV